ncbi:MAG: tRNA 2-selenouridine(34) synthase MnmH, partial [Halioglobus sp.]
MNSQRPDTEDYRALFLQHTPMMDMRAPVEFLQGSFPGALSLPLMSDDERAQVGTCYKAEGQEAAIALGHSLVHGAEKELRLQQWLAFAERFEQGYLYCFRGGLRSQTVQQWLREAGVHYPLVRGGYKAMRRFLIDELQRSITSAAFILIAGKTGTGKTRVVERLSCCVDLEGLANHRGSSFGQLPNGQPSQIDFENALSIAFLRLLEVSNAPIFLEDEGRLIGRLSLPEALREKMVGTPMVLVEESLDSRVEVVVEDYVLDLGRRYELLHGEQGAQLHCEKLLSDLSRIRKRLGGVRYQKAQALVEAGFAQQWSQSALDGHREWISFLLNEYYDPMYEYQLEQRGGRYLFQGDR